MMTSTTGFDYWCLDNLASFYQLTKVQLLNGGKGEKNAESHNSEPSATEIFIAGCLAG